MRKISWPNIIGSPDLEPGASSSKSSEKNLILQDTQTPSDALVTEKFTMPENQIPTYATGEGMIGGMSDEAMNLSDDAAYIEVMRDGDQLADFDCDLAKSFQEKMTGLQSYSELSNNAGLLFPYKKPQDVIYHMGTVSFPIDIIFVDGQNKVKKIYKNIQPGSLATYGCAEVKNVLEICGGLCDRLGIKSGDDINIHPKKTMLKQRLDDKISSFGTRKNSIVKYSNNKEMLSNWKNFPILTTSKKALNKSASLESNLLYDFVEKFYKEADKQMVIYNFDDMILKSSEIKLYHTKVSSDDSLLLSRNIMGSPIEVVSLDKKLNVINNDKEIDYNKIVLSLNKSFSNFLPHSEEFEKLARSFIANALDKSKKICIATHFDPSEKIKDLVVTRINLEFGENINYKNIDTLKLSSEMNYLNLFSYAIDKYGSSTEIICDEYLFKVSGTPVPEEIKERSKKIYKLLDSSQTYMQESLENIQKNLSEYEKIKDDPETIAKTKGQYNQSVKRNVRIAKEFLIRIRDAIKALNEIKDVSTTMEIINGIVSSSQECSEQLESIFSLIDKIDSPEFFTELTEETDIYESSIDDLDSSIQRAKDYINQHILGIVVLSD